MKHLFPVPGTRSTELATFEPLSHSDHAKAITESRFSLAPPVYKGLIEQIARLFSGNKLLNCYVVNTSALGYLPPNEFGELLNINQEKELPHRILLSISVKSMECSPLS